MQEVFITNKTPFQISFLGLTVPSRAKRKRFSVADPKHVKKHFEMAYQGKVFVSLSAEEQPAKQDTIEPPAVTLQSLELSSSIEAALEKAGVDSIEALTAMSLAELDAVKGIGDSSIKDVQEALAAHGLSLKEEGEK